MPLENGAFLLVDSYKSAQETIVAGINTLAELQADRKIVVLGDIEDPKGPQGPLYRELGVKLARVVTRIIYVGGKKTYLTLASGAQDAGLPREHIVYAGRSPRRAADIVAEDLGGGDIVLIKGRSTQQLERVAFQLAGRPVPCDLHWCELKTGCADCPLTKHLRLKENNHVS